MASLDTEMRVKVGIDIEPFEWKTIRAIKGDDNDLAELLNVFSGVGWDVFTILTAENGEFILVLRRPVKDTEEGL